jgi:queuine tRNA-ribosyltransferase
MNARYPCDYNYAKRSMKMTHRWLDRCINHLDTLPFKYGYEQTFFPVQGSTYKDLRAQSAEYIANSNQQGNAIGGLSVGNLQRKCMRHDWWCVKFYQRTNQGI